MEELLKQVSVADFPTFKEEAMKKLGWTRQQFNDRKIGRIKIHPLEMKELQKIVKRINKDKQL